MGVIMSMYNLINGMNPSTDEILSLIGLKRDEIQRFRDVRIDADAKKIVILTRTGGGNRDDYPNEVLTSNEHYIEDHDASFDSTYAIFVFNLPEAVNGN